MELHVADHPLIAHKLTVLRDERTDSARFRQLTDELVTLLAYEATRNIRVTDKHIRTPVQETVGVELATPRPLVVPILRAGLGMLDGMMRMIPTAEVGFLGMVRNDETLEVTTYAERLPSDLKNRQVYVVDPMLATGNTLIMAIEYLLERGVSEVAAVCLVSAPEGVKAVSDRFEGRANISIHTAAYDEGLNDDAYIVPGLGDAGDRLYGVV